MGNTSRILPVAVACTVFGCALGASLLATIMDNPVAWVASDHRSDWLGFWGGVTGGLMTLLAAGLAWLSFRQQIAQARWPQERAQRVLKRYAEYVGERGDAIRTYSRPFTQGDKLTPEDIVGFWSELGVEGRYPSMTPSVSDAEACLAHVDFEITAAARACIISHASLETRIKTFLEAENGSTSFIKPVDRTIVFELYQEADKARAHGKYLATLIARTTADHSAPSI